MKHVRHKTLLLFAALLVAACGMLLSSVAPHGVPAVPGVDTPESASTSLPLAQPAPMTRSVFNPEPASTPATSRSTSTSLSAHVAGGTSSTAPAEPVSRLPAVTPLMRLPLDAQELMPDGLPASAIRCTQDGGVYTCGSCRTDGDCAPGRACLPNRETRRFECLDAECEEDVHCFPGFVCRTLGGAGTNAPPIRRCVPEGQRQQGEPCDPSPLSPQGTCREGLRCVLGVCGTPCRPDDPGSCPAEQLCEEGFDGPACVADCRRRGCPGEQRCKQLEGSRYQCLRVDQGSCPETPCPEGFHCNRLVGRGRGVFWCARTCDSSLAGSCHEGEVCGTMRGRSTCYRQCDASDPGSCGEGWTCASGAKDLSFFGCMPDFAP